MKERIVGSLCRTAIDNTAIGKKGVPVVILSVETTEQPWWERSLSVHWVFGILPDGKVTTFCFETELETVT